MLETNNNSNFLPINTSYFTWLRDYGRYNRPASIKQAINNRTRLSQIIQKTEMDITDYIIYVNLLSYADENTLICSLPIALLCKNCFNLDRRTIFNHLSDLEMMGFINIKKEKGKKNIYYMKDFAEWLKNPRYCEDISNNATLESRFNRLKRDLEAKSYILQPGYIYFVQDDQGRVKIGKAKNLENRLGEYTKLPVKPKLIYHLKADNYTLAEALIHEYFSGKRLRGEWFALTVDDIEFIQNGELEKMILENE